MEEVYTWVIAAELFTKTQSLGVQIVERTKGFDNDIQSRKVNFHFICD